MTADRRDELAANLDAVRRRIEAAASAAGRDADEVTLVAVTKFFPASDVRLLAELGVTDVGENRHQEAQAKVAECADLDLRWHFIGGLQSNKAAAVASYADVVESVDRAQAGGRRSTAARTSAPSEIDVLLQVSLDPPGREGRAGADPERAGRPRGRRRGRRDAAAARADGRGATGRGPGAGVRAAGRDPDREFVTTHPDATWLSAGMSDDLEAAVGAGATHVRLGTAVLGPRPLNK